MSKSPFQALFKPMSLGIIPVNNRIWMAPLTRSRANNPERCVHELHQVYYSQRATAGLIISEATVVNAMGIGYPHTPGIYTDAQIDAWRKVCTKVHRKGGRIFCQLWHVGRQSHPSFLNGELPLAPSPINPNKKVLTATGVAESITPREMTIEEIKSTIQDFVQASINALKAGFDGVEIHAANGYLFHQFFAKCSNHRNDAYGGSIENRCRIIFELLDALKEHVQLERVGIRFNPMMHELSGMTVDEETLPTFNYLLEKLNQYPIAYVHLCYITGSDSPEALSPQDFYPHFRSKYKGVLVGNGGINPQAAEQLVASKTLDAVAFGKLFISNPDLPYRLENRIALAEWDKSTFYTQGEKGYSDYPMVKKTKK